MGRKKKNIEKIYFGEVEELAFERMLNAETQLEKTKIYNEFLQEPFNRLIDSIIRTYNLYDYNETYKQIHSDCLTYISSKMINFKPSKNKKAYSYFGTIAKRYLFNNIKNNKKNTQKNSNYEEVLPQLINREDMIYDITTEEINFDKLFLNIINSIKEEIKIGENLSENEIKLGEALIEIFTNWNLIYEDITKNGGSKFNKSLIRLYIKNISGLDSNEIRNSLKRYKIVYKILKNDFFKD